jgi:TrmH family RNA methyltransferase
MDKIITSAANPTVKKLKSLAVKKYRDEEGLFLVEGAQHISDALERGWELETLAYSKNDPVIKKARCVVLQVTDDILSRITGRDNTQPVIGVFKQKWQAVSKIKDGLWLGLEEIRDPGNLGTIIRTAGAVGVEGIVLIGNTCDPFSPETIRASTGSFAKVKLAGASLAEFLKWRPSWKGRVIGTHLQTKTDYRKADYSLPLLLMMGGEQSGLSAEATKVCDTLVKIPMTGETESLNLSVSAGVMLYEVCRGRL